MIISNVLEDNRNLLVLVNPISGKRQGLEIYQRFLKPELNSNQIKHKVILTTDVGDAELRVT